MIHNKQQGVTSEDRLYVTSGFLVVLSGFGREATGKCFTWGLGPNTFTLGATGILRGGEARRSELHEGDNHKVKIFRVNFLPQFA